jgi:hypothetical protein
MAKYDDASWHYEGDFPDDLPENNGATHIGMLLTWIIENGMYSEEFEEDFIEELTEVKNKTLTGAGFLIQCCEGKLSDYDLNDSGNEFVGAYYDENSAFCMEYGSYLQDYTNSMNADARYETLYHIEDTWDNYAQIKPLIDQRFEEWQHFKKGE